MNVILFTSYLAKSVIKAYFYFYPKVVPLNKLIKIVKT